MKPLLWFIVQSDLLPKTNEIFEESVKGSLGCLLFSLWVNLWAFCLICLLQVHEPYEAPLGAGEAEQ